MADQRTPSDQNASSRRRQYRQLAELQGSEPIIPHSVPVSYEIHTSNQSHGASTLHQNTQVATPIDTRGLAPSDIGLPRPSWPPIDNPFQPSRSPPLTAPQYLGPPQRSGNIQQPFVEPSLQGDLYRWVVGPALPQSPVQGPMSEPGPPEQVSLPSPGLRVLGQTEGQPDGTTSLHFGERLWHPTIFRPPPRQEYVPQTPNLRSHNSSRFFWDASDPGTPFEPLPTEDENGNSLSSQDYMDSPESDLVDSFELSRRNSLSSDITDPEDYVVTAGNGAGGNGAGGNGAGGNGAGGNGAGGVAAGGGGSPPTIVRHPRTVVFIRENNTFHAPSPIGTDPFRVDPSHEHRDGFPYYGIKSCVCSCGCEELVHVFYQRAGRLDMVDGLMCRFCWQYCAF